MNALTSNSLAHRRNFFAIIMRIAGPQFSAISSNSGSIVTRHFLSFMPQILLQGVGHLGGKAPRNIGDLFTSKTPLLALLLLLFAALSSFGQTNRASLNGWRTAKWGMKPEEADVALGDAGAIAIKPEPFNGGNALVLVPNIMLNGDPFQAKLVFNDSRKLFLVQLTPDGAPNPEGDFEPLLQMLTEKYGQPDYTADEHGDLFMRKRSWKLGKTRIELKIIKVAGDNLLSIDYREIASAGDQNL
jgi:hypothetical protein